MPRHRDLEIDAAILATGAALIREVGYDAFSIEQVARRLGKPRSTVYSRWKSRAELLDALLSGYLTVDTVQTGELHAALAAMLDDDIRLAASADGRALARLLLSSLDRSGIDTPRVRERLTARRQQYMDLLSGRGTQPRDVETAVDLALAAVRGASLVPVASLPDATRLAEVLTAMLT